MQDDGSATPPSNGQPNQLRPAGKAQNQDTPLDRGYWAGAHVDAGGGQRARRIALTVTSILIVAFALAALDPVVSLPPLPFDDDLSPSGEPRTLVSPLPALQRDDAFAPGQPLPLLAGGLRWLDPLTGRLSGTPYEGFRGAPFVMADGAVLCVCLDRPWTQSGAIVRVSLVRETGPNEPTTSIQVLELQTNVDEPFGDAIVVEPAISPDDSTVYLATIVREVDGVGARVFAVDAASGEIGGKADVPLPAGEGGPVLPIVRVSPDGRGLLLTVWSTTIGQDPREAWAPHAFAISVGPNDPSDIGPPVAVEPLSPQTSGPFCFGEAYVATGTYGALCDWTGANPPRLSLQVKDARDFRRSFSMPATLTSALDVQVDAEGGRVFVWSFERRAIARLDVASGEVTSRAYGFGDSVASISPTEPRPYPVTDPVRWVNMRSASEAFGGHKLLGSPDGLVLFAIGGGSKGLADLPASTGVWVIDADTLDLVDVWAPAAYYHDIALTFDGEYVVALGLSGVNEAGASAPWPPSITYHRAQNGRVVELIGSIDGLAGWTPVLLSTAN